MQYQLAREVTLVCFTVVFFMGRMTQAHNFCITLLVKAVALSFTKLIEHHVGATRTS